MQLPARIGKYELEEFLGGGMAHVYRARDTVLGRTVAMKFLTEAALQDEEAKSRFLAEARLASGMVHENILGIYDFGEDDAHRPYMVMEFLRGEDLRHAIRDGRTGDLAGKLKIALQVARALQYIHSQKIIHRDIKPENIHIATNGVVKLMDFGIAKTEGLSMTRAGFVLGTPYYMSPEQIMGHEVTEQADVYGFGILLFELFAGTKAIMGETVERVFYQILNEPLNLEPLRQSGVPQPLCDLVARCTAKNPAERPQGFDPICAALQDMLVDRDSGDRFPAQAIPFGQPASAPQRPIWPAILVAAAVLISICVWAGMTWISAAALLAGAAGGALAMRYRTLLERHPSGETDRTGTTPRPQAGASLPAPAVTPSPSVPPMPPALGPAHEPPRSPAGDRDWGSPSQGAPSPPSAAVFPSTASPSSAGVVASGLPPSESPANPPARPSAVTPASAASGPGEFTRLLQASAVSPLPSPRESTPSVPPPPPGPTAVTPSASEPGEFTRMFRSSLPAALSPRGGAVSPAPPSAPMESPQAPRTGGQPLPGPPPPSARPAPASPAQAPGEFTQMFQTSPGPANEPSSAPAAPAPRGSPAERPEEFTRMFRVDAGESQAPADAETTPDVALAIAACDDLTMVGKQFPLRAFPFQIGRPAGDLPLSFDAAISRQHAELSYENGVFLIQDLGSANGTFVNGKRLRPREPEPLLFGARILLGSNTLLTFISNELTELPDLIGALVGGRYILSERLLASAKSAVYRGSDTKLPQAVLVKVLSPRLTHHPGYREQFDREAKVAVRLHHPNITRVLDYGDTELPGESGRSLYICMPYLEGGSLAHRLAEEQPPFELPRVAGWLEKLVAGLQYVHEQKIVHGSIKPSAIVFDAADVPYLTDFAIAVAADDRSHRTVIGSPPFLAPEQWEGDEVSPATDQYSLAVLFYLILTRSYPYEGQEHPAARSRNFLRGPMPAHEMAQKNNRPALPVEVSPVLQRAMAVNPADRFPAVLDFGNALREALAGRGPQRQGRPRVFLSYRRASDSAWALLFRSELDRQYGCEVFVDSEQQDRAGQFPRKLERQIGRCDVFVCLLSENTLDSEWVNREIELAYQGQKPMVPVFLESFQHPRDLSVLPAHVCAMLLYEGVKLLDRQNIFVSAAIQRLSEAIRQSLPGAE